MKMIKKSNKRLFMSVVFGLAIGIVIAVINPGAKPLIGFATSAAMAGACVFFLQFTVDKLEGNRQLRIAAYLAFSLRLIIGILLFLLLPSFGYDEAYNNNGYLYLDAFRRDSDAWQLAQSGAPLSSAFQNEFSTDQYGGLLSLSALIYRFFSPDGHRPLLILILTSFFSAIGLPFFWQAAKHHWNEKIANAGIWILALYPESIILGASQMREPILIGLSAVSFWGASIWGEYRKKSILALAVSVLTMVFISSKAAIAIFAGIALWFWLDHTLERSSKKIHTFSWFFLLLMICAGIVMSWNWLIDSSKWDLYLMESASGRIQWELELIGEKFRAPFIISYGLAQPVLPAAIVYPGIALTRTVAIFRAVGWYLLVPLMASGFLLIWKEQEKKKKRVLILFYILIIIWTVISSARAGGDQWDNPRYRSIFLIWMAFVGAWAWVETINKNSFWLWRILMVEIIYTSFFVQWYLSRYYELFKRMDFWPMIKLLLAIGAVIIFGGLIFDKGNVKFKEKNQ